MIGFFGNALEYSSSKTFGLHITLKAVSASPKFNAKMETQSKDLQAGTTPLHEKTPLVGFNPIRLFNAAGTLPDPAVSVPRESGTIPRPTTEADPADEPPLTYLSLKTQLVIPYGDLVPTKPVANWSKFVLPKITAPASLNSSTTYASLSGWKENAGQAAVVGNPL